MESKTLPQVGRHLNRKEKIMKKNFIEGFRNNAIGVAIVALIYAMVITIVAISSNAKAAEASRDSVLKSVEIDRNNEEWLEFEEAVEEGKAFYLGKDLILHKSTDGYTIELREGRRR